jgi:hypothetical protein
VYGTSQRVSRLLRGSRNRIARIGQEPRATAARMPRALRASQERPRFALSLLAACALLGLAATCRAQDAPKPDVQTPPAPPAQAAPSQSPAPAAPAAAAPGTIRYSGLLDWYFGINFRAPRSSTGGPFTSLVTPSGETIGVDNAGRAFDINDRDPSFSLGEFNVTRTAGKGFPLGITATLTFGDTARIVHATEPGGTSSWQTLQQLYLTYTPHVWGRDIPIDFGAFVTPFGVEVIESSSNDNYSRGFLFLYAIPFYHAGLRATVPITDNLSFLGGIVNGWNNIADDNNAKSLFGQFTWKPNARLTGIAGWMGGAEGTGAYGVIVPKNTGNLDTNLFDLQLIYQCNDRLKLAAWGDYGSGAGDFLGKHVSGDWVGFAGYARSQVSPQWAAAVRAEQFEDIPGVGGSGIRLFTGAYTRLREATLTLEYTTLRGHLVSRLEYRHDHANIAFFGAGGGTATPDQDTLTFGQVYKF